MSTQIQYFAKLAHIDSELDYLMLEYGDLPQKVKESERKIQALTAIVNDTERILKEVKLFVKTTKSTISTLKDSEEKLAKQQFLVRNNKEFDAITKEIEHTRQEQIRLTDEIRTSAIKEENIVKLLEQQHHEVAEAEQAYEEKKSEFNEISSGQDDAEKSLNNDRKKIVKYIKKDLMIEYDRIRNNHNDAVVKVRKNSCSGCFSKIPAQKLVESRNNLDKLYTCEHCGRIICPEDIEV